MDADYLSQLNEQQRAAVEYIGGPQLVIAGAGSGKTRVLTYKIVHLLANGYEPGRILALTFTNKAAREMRGRIESLVGFNTAARLWMGTFHSIFSRILRKNADLIGYTRNYTIYDTTDSRSLIKMIIKDMDLDEKVYKVSTVQNAISWAKNSLICPEAYAADRELMASDARSKHPRIYEIYKGYMARCRVSDAMDFDDLLYYTAVLLRDNPPVLRHYREFFRYVLVDEFQDTNFAQNYIMTMLTQGIGDICVVGDDAQSIYSFRGANIRNILELKRAYPDLMTFKLEQNYRSTQNIINAANSLIDKNERQIRKQVYSLNDVGDRVEVQAGHSDYDEAGLVASRIVVQRARTGDPLSEFAILYRTNAQSRVLEEALRRRNILYKIYGGLAFYQRKEVKDAIAYFRMAVNPDDDEALKRIINVPARGIGATTLSKISSAAIEHGVSMWQVVIDPHKYSLNINSGTSSKLKTFAAIIDGFITRKDQDAESLAKHIIQSTGLISQYMTERTPENVSKVQNLEELITGAREFVEDRREQGMDDRGTMADFLANVSLQTDQDTEDPALADSVTLMTIHAAKGLEFSNVFVVGVEEDLLPSSMGNGTPDEVEEERRLFYVAITRAKKFCMLSYAGNRYINGQTTTCRPSRFIKDINPQYLKYSYGAEALQFAVPQRQRYVAPAKPAQSSNVSPRVSPVVVSQRTDSAAQASGGTCQATDYALHSVNELTVGMTIIHPRFGRGTIQAVQSIDLGDSANVQFDNEATPRKLLLKFAKFKIID
ncbi:MAG: UvrD-helicase domain-containing protein [Muribaculaceae bacterium]|nr:UvrD-helicase domain-containing protein [Muribaculaceae bacterium]